MPETRFADIVRAIDAEILSRISGSVASYTIAGRSFTKTPLADLHEARRVYADMAALQGGFGTTHADLSRESVEGEQWG